ncbi:MAG: adenosine kinase [Reichenbachiella sp.]|uniref:adenosine kinase n=1 Tax=Reichenbachiella sp. TaxID=2184521 RepID=UPI0032671704
MKKYDVYGIGNALVDLVFEVDDKFFKDHKVEKGLMTLVEEEHQNRLINAIDIHENMMKGGGSAANTIVASSQFGASCYYSCKVSNDDFGQFFLKDLSQNGVDTKLTKQTAPDGITGKCLVMVTPDAERTMNTFLGITSDFSANEIDEEAIKNSNYIYSEGYLVPSPSGREAMIRGMEVAKANGVKVAMSFSDPSMVKFFKNEMVEVVGDGVDLLFCNEEEALLYTGADNLLAAREELKLIAKRFAITLGKNGATIFDGDTFVDIESYKVDAIDTNGAGDMFAGAFLYGITHGHSYAEAGKIASLASSKVVSQFGPRLEWHQAKEILNHLFED